MLTSAISFQLLAKTLEFLLYPKISIPELIKYSDNTLELEYLRFEITIENLRYQKDKFDYLNIFIVENKKQMKSIMKKDKSMRKDLNLYVITEENPIELPDKNEWIINKRILINSLNDSLTNKENKLEKILNLI